MRILHLSSLYPPHIVGGCERSVEHLAEELVAMGHTVGAACIAVSYTHLTLPTTPYV